MAGVRHKEVAGVLSAIANEFIDLDPRTPVTIPMLRICTHITTFMESQPESLQDLYDSKLNITSQED